MENLIILPPSIPVQSLHWGGVIGTPEGNGTMSRCLLSASRNSIKQQLK